jgi:hypothetical protein
MLSKKSCIIASGNWGSGVVLFKTRDRNYIPPVKIYHEIRNGVEIAYMKDERTFWCEGINEFGIGIVNSALATKYDEKERDMSFYEGKKTNPKNLSKDSEWMLKALEQKTLADAVEVLCQSEMWGHTFVTDGKTVKALEMTSKHECIIKTLRKDKIHVRTNHGIFHLDAGYQDGYRRDSSESRRNRAIKVLRTIENVDEMAEKIYGYRVGDVYDQNNMVRDGRFQAQMRSTSQLILNPEKLHLTLFVIPQRAKFLGYHCTVENPKIQVSVKKYTQLRGDNSFDVLDIDIENFEEKQYDLENHKIVGLKKASIKKAMLAQGLIKNLNDDVKKN